MSNDFKDFLAITNRITSMLLYIAFRLSVARSKVAGDGNRW